MKNWNLQQAARAVVILISVAHTSARCHAGTLKTIFAFPDFADGALPVSIVIFENGIIYGNTRYGGTGCTELTSGCGTPFQFNPATGAEAVLHSFLFTPDGGFPEAGPLYANGVFYGATQQGGADYGGSVYAYNPATNTESVVVSFNGANGVNPGLGSLAAHNSILYGVTSQGSTDNQRVIYSWIP